MVISQWPTTDDGRQVCSYEPLVQVSKKLKKSGRYRNLQIFFFSFPKIVSQNVIKIATCRYIDTCQLLYLLREFLL
jgi:hypothetical protein